ncbi:unnamed protein product [Acanthocheilonema viteae]|uniref:DUF5641 domain-containing protein n=1 Tax=Acanthocheilonema viteae TaxID=6277 RepID=A0A498SVJ2_ACAVI|nr:unnamed protein product [Acanthocheilonema viteae]
MERWVFKWLKGTLTEKGHKSPKSVEERVPSEGEMVLVKGTEAPRGTWKLAKIKKLNISADGRVRSVQIEIPKGKLLNRPTKPKRKNNLELREPEMLQGDNKIKADPTKRLEDQPIPLVEEEPIAPRTGSAVRQTSPLDNFNVP